MTAEPWVFGKYTLTEKIATGGMAEIYLAKLIGPGGFEKQLVIKQIHPELSKQRPFVELFVAEAKTLVGLTHGNIVPVYELGMVGATYFLAMEYIDGPALAALMEALDQRGSVMEPAMAAYIISELLKGLDYAHRKGESVIHRDVSPRNVMVSREGEVKLVDFGLAVTELDERDRRKAAGRPAGSYPYMSPEQVRQEPLDGRSDLFSAGILFWEMLTGERLFARDDADETLEAVLKAPIALPSQRRTDLPEALDAICERALQRDRDERYQTAGEFLAAVNRFMYSLESPVSPVALSRLVALNCPPRKAGTADPRRAAESSVPKGEGTVPMEGRSMGKRRAQTRTFATNVHFEEVLANATPLMSFDAITDDLAQDLGQADAVPRQEPSSSEAPAHERSNPRAAPIAPVRAGSALRWVGLVALLACAVAVGLWLAPDGSTQGANKTFDASVANVNIPALSPDASVVDAATLMPMDAARVDASQAPRPRTDAAPQKKGVGTLVVGARPWGIVIVDGTRVGQAPGRFTLSAGTHKVRVENPDLGTSKEFSIKILADETKALGPVDLTNENL